MKSIVIYATKYGCAEEAAKRVKAQLGGETVLCNIRKETVPPLGAYDTVVLGGSVYIGKIQKQITKFCESHQNELLNKNLGLFICAGAPDEDSRSKELEDVFPQALLQHATAKDVLGYAYLFEKMNFFDRLVIKKVKGDSISSSEYFNDRIAAFAESLTIKNEKNSTE